MTDICIFQSPLGRLKICTSNEGVTEVSITDEKEKEPDISGGTADKTRRELKEYFAKERTEFDLPLCPSGTEFQKKVWMELTKIGYGQTKSYEEIAEKVGSVKAVRAVGQANHKNPILIIIPCHRVIRKDGKIGGYGLGVDAKRMLLELEGRRKVY